MALKKCKECGEEISSSAKKCPKCGKDQRNFFMKHPILYTILIIFVLGMIGSGDTENVDNNVTVSSSKKEDIIYNVGDSISNGIYEITIDDVKTKTKVGSNYLNTTVSEGGIYVCVDYNVKNISTQPISSFELPTLKLMDSNKVEYTQDFSASTYYATETEPDRKTLSDLNPGIKINDNDVFEVSKESYDQGEWYLIIDRKIKVKIK